MMQASDTRASAARVAARRVIEEEARALARLAPALDDGLADAFDRVLDALLRPGTKAVTTGLGKSGIVARKIAATLTSTGTPAVFLHPVEALHGDLGIVSVNDVAIVVSKSGEVDDFAALLPALRRRGACLVAITSSHTSQLGALADITLETGFAGDAGPLEAVPTISAITALALGDALAVGAFTRRGLSPDDLALVHPGGAIGRRLLLRVADVMHDGSAVPRVRADVPLREAIQEIMEKRLGLTTIVGDDGGLLGVLTDGDFKRLLLSTPDIFALTVGQALTTTPRTIEPDALVASAIQRMEDDLRGPVTALIVVDDARCVVGVVHLHDCLAAGVR